MGGTNVSGPTTLLKDVMKHALSFLVMLGAIATGCVDWWGMLGIGIEPHPPPAPSVPIAAQGVGE